MASRFCHPAEINHSPVEGEALSAAVGLHKFKHFIMGCKLLFLVVDHKPLIKLLGDKCLDDIPNTRLLRLKEKTLQFQFQVVHRPRLMHKAPDFVSRYPQGAPYHFLEECSMVDEIEECVMVKEIEVLAHDQIVGALEEGRITNITWQMLKQATSADTVLSRLREMDETGEIVSQHDCPHELKPYLRYWERLWSQDGVVLLDNRTIIPKRLQTRVLDCLHSAHQGVSQMYARAECSIFWPGMHADIENMRNKCDICRINAPSMPKMPPHTPEPAEYPFQKICCDYMSLNGVSYLVTVDRLTG